jgi:hypothetical protein
LFDNVQICLATKDTEELTIRKLTYKNITMKAKFEEEQKHNEVEELTKIEEL